MEKKSFDIGVIIKVKKCANCIKNLISDVCDKLFNQAKLYKPNLNEIKRKPLNEKGYPLTWCKNNFEYWKRENSYFHFKLS